MIQTYNYVALPGIPREPTLSQIVLAVANFYGVSVYQIYCKGRRQPVCKARQIVMYFMRRLLLMKYIDIAKLFHRDHSSVMHAEANVKENMKDEIELFERKLIGYKRLGEKLIATS